MWRAVYSGSSRLRLCLDKRLWQRTCGFVVFCAGSNLLNVRRKPVTDNFAIECNIFWFMPNLTSQKPSGIPLPMWVTRPWNKLSEYFVNITGLSFTPDMFFISLFHTHTLSGLQGGRRRQLQPGSLPPVRRRLWLPGRCRPRQWVDSRPESLFVSVCEIYLRNAEIWAPKTSVSARQSGTNGFFLTTLVWGEKKKAMILKSSSKHRPRWYLSFSSYQRVQPRTMGGNVNPKKWHVHVDTVSVNTCFRWMATLWKEFGIEVERTGCCHGRWCSFQTREVNECTSNTRPFTSSLKHRHLAAGSWCFLLNVARPVNLRPHQWNVPSCPGLLPLHPTPVTSLAPPPPSPLPRSQCAGEGRPVRRSRAAPSQRPERWPRAPSSGRASAPGLRPWAVAGTEAAHTERRLCSCRLMQWLIDPEPLYSFTTGFEIQHCTWGAMWVLSLSLCINLSLYLPFSDLPSLPFRLFFFFAVFENLCSS